MNTAEMIGKMSDSAIPFVSSTANNSAFTDENFEKEKFLVSIISCICSAVILLATLVRTYQGWNTRKGGLRTWIRSMEGSCSILMLFAGLFCALQILWTVVGERIMQ